MKPTKILAAVLYALAEQQIGAQARLLSLVYSPARGWHLAP